ncbi:MAG: hypothetical protein JRF15_07620 [Deltaproteobacteria bacterium]|jgi:hypothetical protein|nr:hypothetical protein [Deltaproteobacteria bacterium]
MGFAQLLVAAKRFHTARSLEANFRKARLCFGLGTLAYALGTFVWSWYELVAHVLTCIGWNSMSCFVSPQA